MEFLVRIEAYHRNKGNPMPGKSSWQRLVVSWVGGLSGNGSSFFMPKEYAGTN
jgi:hypothetical protein